MQTHTSVNEINVRYRMHGRIVAGYRAILPAKQNEVFLILLQSKDGTVGPKLTD